MSNMRGRPRKPLARHLLEGTDRVSHRRGIDAPRSGPDDMCPPVDFKGFMRAEWERTVASTAPGHLLPAHRPLLRQWCVCQDILYRAETELAKHAARPCQGETSLTVRGARGGFVPHPALKIISDYTAALRLLAGELGLSPVGRERVSAPDGPQLGLALGDSVDGTLERLAPPGTPGHTMYQLRVKAGLVAPQLGAGDSDASQMEDADESENG
jgi:phage terminase small subunit